MSAGFDRVQRECAFLATGGIESSPGDLARYQRATMGLGSGSAAQAACG